MAGTIEARRYAQAVFQIALEKEQLDTWQADLEKIASLGNDAALTSLLENPKLHFEDVSRVLGEQLSDLNPLAMNLLDMLVSRGILGLAGEIAREYQRLLDERRGIEPAEVITATELDEAEKESIEERLGALLGKKVVVRPKVDPDIIGGIIIKAGGKLLDGSTRSRLEDLKKKMSGKTR